MNTALRPQPARGLARAQRGQAMLEYSILTWALAGTALAGLTLTPLLPTVIRALQTYVDLFFYALNVALG